MLYIQLNTKGFTFYTYTLGDTRVNGFLFINLELASLLIRHYSACLKPLPYAIPVTGYDRKSRA